MTFNDLELRIVSAVRERVCGNLPPRSPMRVLAEVGILLAAGKLEVKANEFRPQLEALGVVGPDGTVDTARLRPLVRPAFESAGGCIEAMTPFGTLKVTPDDVLALLEEENTHNA